MTIATKEEIRAKLAAARKPQPKQCTVVMMTRPGHDCCGIKDSSCPILVLTGDDQAERAAAVVAKFQAGTEGSVLPQRQWSSNQVSHGTTYRSH